MGIDTPPSPSPVPSLRLVTLLLAVACGLSVANVYYAQPLLSAISRQFDVSPGHAALVVTATQIGYAAGLLFLIPLGDLLENRALVSRTLIATAICLAVAASAPSFGLFLAASVLVGVTSVVAQILIPYAAHLAPDAERGRYVGTVMSGLLLGILLARTTSSLLAAAWGWRTVFALSAAAMVLLAITLAWVLPPRQPSDRMGYRRLMATTAHLVVELPALRRRAVTQGLLFATFSCFWSSIAFELMDRHHLGQVGIGLFALIGAGGAVAAPLAGWLGDRGHGTAASGAALTLVVVALLMAAFGSANLVVLTAAGLLLDLAVQGHQVLSQREIYALRADARSRINSVFMTSVFSFGAAGSAASALLYDHGGWRAVALLGAGLSAISWTIWAVAALRHRGGSRQSELAVAQR